MKKLLFCAGVLALAASCTEELDTLSVQQEQAEGITFTAVAPQENAATKGEFEEGANGNVWYPFWSAETDQINIYATNVIKNEANKGGSGAVTFSTSALERANKASYKATRSERNAYFTASNEVDILDFAADVDEDAPATFLAVYPKDVTLSTDATVNWKDGFKVKLDLDGVLTSTQTQTNQQGKGIYELNVKYAVATGYPQASNKVAVGENVPLQFNRILSGLVFKTVGVDPYTVDEDIFGKLASIKVTMDGEYKDGKKVTATDAEKASKLTYDSGSSVGLAIAKDGTIKETPDFKQTSASPTITLKLDQEWNDDARGYMIITPVSRVDKDKKAWTEGVKVVYTFDKIEFIAPVLETSNSWNANEFIPVPALDINDYPWLVVKGDNNSYAAGNNDLTLIINEGADFDKMYDADDETIAWEWDNSSTTEKTVNASQIQRIICNIDLTDAQLKTIGSKFESLKDITYNVETSIPAGAFAKQAANITRLVMPKVTEINKDFSKDGTAAAAALASLEELNLESYQFPSTDINYLLFDGMEDASNNVLKKLNMKAVTDMTAEFDLNRTIAFEGFAALEEVVMGEDVIASQKAFKDCKALVSVKGSLDLNSANAVEAFENAGSNNTYNPKKPNESFSTINITSDEIPADAFNGASCLVNVLKDGKQVVPTYIGKNAFKGATSLVTMDLSKAATIGENAFNGATSYVGISGQTRLNVEAATIEEGILAETKVVNVYFTNATKVNGPIFTSCKALEQVEFAKTFTAARLAAKGWNGAFGSTSENVDLFIQNGQSYYNRDSANVLALPEGTDKAPTTNEITFKSIKVRTAAE